MQTVLTISCTLNFPDSLSLVEDWIRFSSDCFLLGFLTVDDADFDFNFSVVPGSGKFCFRDLDVDNIKAYEGGFSRASQYFSIFSNMTKAETSCFQACRVYV